MIDKMEDAVSFQTLQWDTDFFGISCAKAILYKPLRLEDWSNLKHKFSEYQFISIENRNSEPMNAQLIGMDTKAFLADVNIQFRKKLDGLYGKPENIEIYQALEKDNRIIELAEFVFSRFTQDPELAKRGGNQVYEQWLLNSFEKPNKYFGLSKNENNRINGFVLFSYANRACIIELIAVSKDTFHSGIGTRLFRTVEYAASKRGCAEIRVGTQARNLQAIHFYHKVGCKQVGCHQVYHLWMKPIEGEA